ncbi:MAG: hypothetical protein ABSG93_13225 [Solirubrobacteraceae bacterium]
MRKANGLGTLQEFSEAYRRHPPGIDCELVLAMKGFASPDEAQPYLREVADLAPEPVFFPDSGFDQGLYLAAAARLRRGRYCFMNSHGRPQVDGWLAKLNTALDRPRVGMVSPTAHWASAHSWLMYSMGLPSAYRGLMPPRKVARELFLAIEVKQKGKRKEMENRSRADRVRTLLSALRDLPEGLLGFEPFPARNLRPNAFMINHATLREMRLFVVHSKLDTYVLEGSRASYTRQVERMGLLPLVVDAAGAVYGPEEWHRSRTFWQGDQEGLLVGDNQTLSYTLGDSASRNLLSTFAWGPSAEPSFSREDSPEELTLQP